MAKDLSDILSAHKGRRNELIPILQKIQARDGYLAEDVIAEVAEFTHVAESSIFGMASFYTQFRFQPAGKNIVTVCRGTACHVRGAPSILDELKRILGIDEGETTSDLEYSLETVACIGCCALAPCIKINKDVHGRLTPEKVKKLFNVTRPDAEGEQDAR